MQIIHSIQNSIFDIRGERIMLDFNLATLYEVETRALNQAVKRNIERFPEDFMFQLTPAEWAKVANEMAYYQQVNASSSQIVMIEIPKNRKEKYLPYAFTEQGVKPPSPKGEMLGFADESECFKN